MQIGSLLILLLTNISKKFQMMDAIKDEKEKQEKELNLLEKSLRENFVMVLVSDKLFFIKISYKWIKVCHRSSIHYSLLILLFLFWTTIKSLRKSLKTCHLLRYKIIGFSVSKSWSKFLPWRGFEPRPLDWQSSMLTTRPPCTLPQIRSKSRENPPEIFLATSLQAP